MNLLGICKNGLRVALTYGEENLPTILTGAGTVGYVYTVYKVYKETPTYVKILEEYEEKEEKVTVTEKAATFCRVYWPAILSGTFSLGCFIFANHLNLKRIAALGAAYSLADRNLKDYKEKAEELLGKKAPKVEESVHTSRIAAIDSSNASIICTGGDTLILDPTSQRVFKGDINKINNNVNILNDVMLKSVKNAVFDDDATITLNKFYKQIGLPEVPYGDNLGWKYDRDGLISVNLTEAEITQDGQPCIYMDYEIHPINDWDEVKAYKGF